ncbi:MAG: hypothetical protein WCH65_00210 [bacterium]
MMYPIVLLFIPVSVFPFTEGIVSLSLVISFSISCLAQVLVILSIVSFTFVHFGHLILLTASFTSSAFVDQVLIITILSSIWSPAINAGEPLTTSSI